MRMRAAALMLMAALPALGAEQTSHLANLTLRETTQPYTISGRSSAEIAAELRRHGAIASSPDEYREAYVWRLQWHVEPQPTTGGCRVGDVEVELVSILSLPQWTAPSGAPASLKSDWSRFESALHAHEWQHRNMTVSRAQQLRPRLLRLTAQTCDSLVRGTDYVAQGWLEDMRKQNEDLDAKTSHGAGQGARWPPATPR